MTPEQVAAELWGVDAASLHAVRIKGGLTNESFSVQGAHESIVVRISTVDEHRLQLNRRSEAVVLKLVETAGIGPQVLLCEPERRLLVTRQLQAETLTPQALRDPTVVQQLSALLRHLHALDAPSTVQQVNLLAILRGYWLALDEHRASQADTSEVRAYAADIAAESVRSVHRCLCHNDVHHLNVMSNGQRLWLLDWEYAGVGDPFFDLAAVCCYHDYDQALREQLLLAYRGELRLEDSAHLQRMCWLFDYIKALWFEVRELQRDA